MAVFEEYRLGIDLARADGEEETKAGLCLTALGFPITKTPPFPTSAFFMHTEVHPFAMWAVPVISYEKFVISLETSQHYLFHYPSCIASEQHHG
tara:strand:- start:240 stop:521 length:282 start_codon:yes stop_codon:yes gene_type:complete